MKAASSRSTPKSANGCNLQTDAYRTHSLCAAAKRVHHTICLATNLITGVTKGLAGGGEFWLNAYLLLQFEWADFGGCLVVLADEEAQDLVSLGSLICVVKGGLSF